MEGNDAMSLQETLKSLENRVHNAPALDPSLRDDLRKLVTTLRTEVEALAETHAEHAESIADFAAASAREAMRRDRNPKLQKLSIEGLSSSVEEFESSHAHLVELVNNLCTLLSNMGI